MRRAITLSFFILGLSAMAWADITGFWLDSPRFRDNPHDPKSPYFRDPPTAVPPTPTFSVTPTITPSSTVSPPWTATNTPTSSDTPTCSSTATDSPTATGTPTASPTATVTPTATESPFVYYDGDSVGGSMDGVNRVPWTVTPVAPGGTTILDSSETSTGGPHTGLFQDRVTIRTLGFPILGGVGNTTGASAYVGNYSALSLWMRSEDGCFEPMVMLHSPGSLNTGTSVMVTATAYTDGAFDSGTWRHVTIPLAAFDGINAWGNPYSLGGNASLVDAVLVGPSFPRSFHYYPAGPFWVFRDIPPTSYNQETMDLDDVQFQALPPLAIKSLSPIFDAFVGPDGITQWGTTWLTFSDAYGCIAPSSSFSFPTPGSPPVDSLSGPLNSCFTGHISGTLGAADGTTAPCAATDLSSLGMAVDLQLGGAALSLTTVPELTLTAGAIKGFSVYVKAGPSAAAVDVDIVLRKASVAAVNDLAHYRHRVSASLLADGLWHWIHVDFPATGAPGVDMAGSWGQPAWAAGAGATVNFDTTDALQLAVMPADTARGQNFDILVGQMAFY